MGSINNSQLFASKQVAATSDTIFSVGATPSTNRLVGGRVRFTNTTGTGATIQAWAGASAADAYEFLGVTTIGPESSLDVDLPRMTAGESFIAVAGTASAITVHDMGGTVFS